jgi:two-component system, NtrC family, sensor kinase
MIAPLTARIAYELPATASALDAVAVRAGLEIVGCVDLHLPAALDDVGTTHVLLLEQRDAVGVIGPRVYSLAGANPDLLIVVVVPHPRPGQDGELLRSGAFDVIADGPDLEADLTRTVAAARRVAALQEERTRLSAELAHQDKLSALGLLAAGVSHEINNPCSASLSNLIFLRDQIEGLVALPRFQRADTFETRASEWIETIGDCIHAMGRITGIVKTLNVFSRKSESKPVPTDVNEEIRNVLRLIGKEVRFRARFELALEPGMPKIPAPPNGLTQVVTNLLVNALQALESCANQEPQLWVSTAFDESQVMLEIRDNGPGMTPEVLARIFDPFFTTKPTGKGTGLGLAISRQLVQNMGGEIFAESEPGKGSRFSVVIERRRAEDVAAELRPKLPPVTERLRVLLVDDDELILRAMTRSLSAHFECEGQGGAQAALRTLGDDADFDVVVSDVVMPDMDGVAFYTALSDRHPSLAARTLFISGGASPQLRERIAETGRPCLAKPLDVVELVRTIRKLGRPADETSV